MFVAGAVALSVSTLVFAAETANVSQTSSNQNQPAVQSTDAQVNTAQTTNTQEKVNINTASMKELMKVKGINRMKARNIISYRKKHGDFKTLDDLKKVKGFKKMKDQDLKAIEDQITIG